GAQQAYHWGVLEPGRARALCCLCGTARTTPHNQLFLLSLRQALTADPTWTGIGFAGIPEAGLRTFALIYASWAASQPFYRQERHRWLGFESVEAYVEQAWLPAYRRHDPRDLLTMIDVWLANDVAAAAGCGDDLAAALARVTAPTLVLAGSHDLYFTPDDCAAEAALLPCGQFGRLESVLGHRAGNPRDDPALQSVLRHALDALLAGGAPPELPLPLGTSPL
ncbi:MAG: homoserine acetyltransferase, partial [Synechococcus sp.]